MAVDANKAIEAVKDVVNFIAWFSKWVVGFALLVTLAVVMIQQFGFPTFGLPTMAHEPMLYYAGAYWLVTARFG